MSRFLTRPNTTFLAWTMSTPGDVILIRSDSEEDELYMPPNGKYILPKKPVSDEIVPDSEGEQESLPLISRTPPRPRQQQQQPQHNDAHSSPLSPVHKRKKKTKTSDTAQGEPKAKKMKAAKVSL